MTRQGPDFHADLRGADLRQADLRDALLAGADLTDADLAGARLNRANLPMANLRSANLMNATLREVDLQGADLRDASLNRVRMVGAKLQGADLRNASLLGADLDGSMLKGANLESAVSDDQTRWPRGAFEVVGAGVPGPRGGAVAAGFARFGTDIDDVPRIDGPADERLLEPPMAGRSPARPEPIMSWSGARIIPDDDPAPAFRTGYENGNGNGGTGETGGTVVVGSFEPTMSDDDNDKVEQDDKVDVDVDVDVDDDLDGTSGPARSLSSIALDQLGGGRDTGSSPTEEAPAGSGDLVELPSNDGTGGGTDEIDGGDEERDPLFETGPIPALGCRIKTLEDRARRTDAVVAINQLITVFWRLQFSSPMTELQEAELQAQIGVLETMLRNPSGPNLIMTERALVTGIGSLQNRFDDSSPIIRAIIDVASRLGAEDRRADGIPLAQMLDLLLRWASATGRQLEPTEAVGYLRPELAAALVIIGAEPPTEDDDEQIVDLARAILRLATAIWER